MLCGLCVCVCDTRRHDTMGLDWIGFRFVDGNDPHARAPSIDSPPPGPIRTSFGSRRLVEPVRKRCRSWSPSTAARHRVWCLAWWTAAAPAYMVRRANRHASRRGRVYGGAACGLRVCVEVVDRRGEGRRRSVVVRRSEPSCHHITFGIRSLLSPTFGRSITTSTEIWSTGT